MLDDLVTRDIAGSQRFGQEILDVEHLGAPALEHLHEGVVLSLRLLDPEHIVEQQIVVIAWGESLQTQFGPVDDDLAQRPNFGLNSIVAHCRLLLRSHQCGPCTSSGPMLSAEEPGQHRWKVVIDR